jgi:hypothetical protein
MLPTWMCSVSHGTVAPGIDWKGYVGCMHGSCHQRMI